MAQPKRVLCIMDLSVIGRSSLAVVTPVLAACGVQACPLPTALFSSHTGGLGSPAVHDTSAFGLEALQHYKQENIQFDAVYIGYLRSEQQYQTAAAAQQQYPAAYHVVDPAIGDHGKLYSSITPEMAQHMQHLCQNANLITPNYTESALLLGLPATTQPLSPSLMQQHLEGLAKTGASVIITSVPTPQNTMEIWGCGPGGQNTYAITAYHVPQNYPGTGDLFTAAVTGLVLRGHALQSAAQIAADFVRAAAITTQQNGADARFGVWFEGQLSTLALAANSLN